MRMFQTVLYMTALLLIVEADDEDNDHHHHVTVKPQTGLPSSNESCRKFKLTTMEDTHELERIETDNSCYYRQRLCQMLCSPLCPCDCHCCSLNRTAITANNETQGRILCVVRQQVQQPSFTKGMDSLSQSSRCKNSSQCEMEELSTCCKESLPPPSTCDIEKFPYSCCNRSRSLCRCLFGTTADDPSIATSHQRTCLPHPISTASREVEVDPSTELSDDTDGQITVPIAPPATAGWSSTDLHVRGSITKGIFESSTRDDDNMSPADSTAALHRKSVKSTSPAVVGIAVGVTVGGLLILGLVITIIIVCVVKRRRRRLVADSSVYGTGPLPSPIPRSTSLGNDYQPMPSAPVDYDEIANSHSTQLPAVAAVTSPTPTGVTSSGICNNGDYELEKPTHNNVGKFPPVYAVPHKHQPRRKPDSNDYELEKYTDNDPPSSSAAAAAAASSAGDVYNDMTTTLIDNSLYNSQPPHTTTDGDDELTVIDNDLYQRQPQSQGQGQGRQRSSDGIYNYERPV